jgi:hypothetical protein
MFDRKKETDADKYIYEAARWITGSAAEYTKKSLKEYNSNLSVEKIEELSMQMIPVKLTLLYLFLIIQYEDIRPIDILSKKIVDISKQVFREKNYSDDDITELLADQIYYHEAIMDDIEYIKYTADFFIRSFKDSIDDKENFLVFLNNQLHLTRAIFEIAFKTGFIHT